ncbi:MAG: hypothetical protein M3Z25_22680 [Actinomycetota bacterium]|nr:hypothetical protein [Actinomycetota bacterium]
MPDTHLDTSDALELTELLQLIADWITNDHDTLNASLTRFIGNPAYNATTLRTDLHRFVFLLGGNDGEPLFKPDQQ